MEHGDNRETFARATRLASALFDGADGGMTLMGPDGHSIWLGSLQRCVTGYAGFCAATVQGETVLWVQDALADARFAELDVVREAPHRRFYVGAPITVDEQRIGAVWVWGAEPLAFDAPRAAQLMDLAIFLGHKLELKAARRRLETEREARTAAEHEIEQLVAFPVAVVMLDSERRIVRHSLQWARDYLPDVHQDVMGRNFHNLLPDTLGWADWLSRALGGDVEGGVISYFGFDGSRRYKSLECAPVRTRGGEMLGVAITSFDVTELVQARINLEAFEAKLNFALDMSDTLVWVMDYETMRTDYEGPIPRMIGPGYDAEKTQADPLSTIHADDLAAVRRTFIEKAPLGRPFKADYRLARPDGEELWVAASCAPQLDAQGRVERVVGLTRDVTELKRTQSALQEAAVAAEAANRAKSEFLANMSHELRTPLNGVMGVTSALARTRLAPGQLEMVELIESSAHALERLLGDVLDLARVESERFALDYESFDLASFVHGVGTMFQWRARDKGVQFACHVDDAAAGVVEGDMVRLRQILSNLLSNALKFTERGSVCLSVRRAGPSDDDDLMFEVTDTGIGFSEETANRLFERFVQADGSITRKYGGTGLGLAISRGLAQRMGGSLTATSVVGEGSTFSLRLPLHAVAPQRALEMLGAALGETLDTPRVAEPPPEAADAEERPPLRILLAEDHPVNRQVVEMILCSAHFQVVAVEDGAQALEAAARERFDLVLMDMQMPVMDGLTAIRAIRSRETAQGSPRTPVMTLTANAMPEHVAASRDAGADAHISKPITAQGLLSAVERMTQPSRPEFALAI